MSENHSFFVHDDEAVEKLLNREWPEFPLLQQARSCIDLHQVLEWPVSTVRMCTCTLHVLQDMHACIYLIWYKFVIEDTCSHV